DTKGNAAALPVERRSEVLLSPDLFTTDGVSSVSVVNPEGEISLPSGVSLNTTVGGSISLSAANIDLQVDIASPGGGLSFTAFNISPAVAALLARTPGSTTPLANVGLGNITVGANATLTTAGQLVDNRNATGNNTSLFVISGGSISFTGFNVNLAARSSVDVSGGALVSGTGSVSYGRAGTITIKAGQDPTIASVLGGKLSLNGGLTGFSGGEGGALRLTAPRVQVGGVSSNADTLWFSPDFFNQGGFTSFSMTGIGTISDSITPEVLIAPDVQIAPMAQSYLANADAGNGGRVTLTTILRPEGLRRPVSLAFNAPGVIDLFTAAPIVRGDLVLSSGASIHTDAGASVSLTGNTIAVLGSIYAPAGTIYLA